MKKLLIIALFLTGCGYSSKDNEVVGQVKKVMKNTPLLCFDYSAADLTLGVMKNGTGSMSTQDQWYYIPDKENEQKLKKFAENGSLVKITYDVKRWTWCVEDHIITNIEEIK